MFELFYRPNTSIRVKRKTKKQEVCFLLTLTLNWILCLRSLISQAVINIHWKRCTKHVTNSSSFVPQSFHMPYWLCSVKIVTTWFQLNQFLDSCVFRYWEWYVQHKILLNLILDMKLEAKLNCDVIFYWMFWCPSSEIWLCRKGEFYNSDSCGWSTEANSYPPSECALGPIWK